MRASLDLALACQGGKEMIKRICQYCGKEFWVKLSRVKCGRGNYCSRECSDKGRKKQIKKICLLCGKTFYIPLSRAIREEGKYCSADCYNKSRPQKIKRICKKCGKPFEISPSAAKEGGRFFCSWECYLKAHPSKVKCICKLCGKTFETIPSQTKRGRGIFCSHSCACKYLRKSQKFPKYHTKPELIFEDICQRNNLPFRYVGDGQLWIGKKSVLNPDFIEANGKKIVVEIFGDYWHSPLFNRNIKKQGTLAYRKKHYKRFKWIPTFIWERDLIREDAEAFILNKLKLYM